MARKQKFDDLSRGDKSKRVLAALKRGRTIQSLATYLHAASAWDVEKLCEEMRASGLILVTNKIWYRKDIPLKPEEPKAPRITEKMEKFLRKQGNLPW